MNFFSSRVKISFEHLAHHTDVDFHHPALQALTS